MFSVLSSTKRHLCAELLVQLPERLPAADQFTIGHQIAHCLGGVGIVAVLSKAVIDQPVIECDKHTEEIENERINLPVGFGWHGCAIRKYQ